MIREVWTQLNLHPAAKPQRSWVKHRIGGACMVRIFPRCCGIMATASCCMSLPHGASLFRWLADRKLIEEAVPSAV
jgi:hypothetical protein